MSSNYQKQCRLIDKEVIMSEKYLQCNDGSIAGIGDKVTIQYKNDYPIFPHVDIGVIERITDQYVYLKNSTDNFGIKIEMDSIDKINYINANHKILIPNAAREKMGPDPIPEVEKVNHPSHYKSETGLEAIDAIEAFTFDLNGIEAFDTGNALKYLCRWKKKNGLEDLKKAQWYLNHLIEHVENLEKENELS